MARTVGSIGTETAKRVLNEALNLFAHHGYAAVSMRQIAGQCDLQVGALYNHFPTKQTILRDLMVTHLEALLQSLENETFPGSPAQKLEAFIRFHIRYHIDRPAEVFIAYMELRNLELEPYREVMKLRQNYERVLRAILREGLAAGVFSIDDVPIAAMGILSMMTGVNTWYRYGGRLSAEEIEDLYVSMVLKVVGLNPQKQDLNNQEEVA